MLLLTFIKYLFTISYLNIQNRQKPTQKTSQSKSKHMQKKVQKREKKSCESALNN